MAAKGVDGPPPVPKSTLRLNILYDPSGTIAVDIVAFHGLGGDAYKTWTRNDKLWLKDLLPQSLDKIQVQGTSSTYILYSLLPRRLALTARIMTLSFDVNILTKATNQRTSTFAEDHLSSVNDLQLWAHKDPAPDSRLTQPWRHSREESPADRTSASISVARHTIQRPSSYLLRHSPSRCRFHREFPARSRKCAWVSKELKPINGAAVVVRSSH